LGGAQGLNAGKDATAAQDSDSYRRVVHNATKLRTVAEMDDNGSAGHGSSGSTNLSGSRRSRVSTRDPLTYDQVNKIPRTGYFVAVMMFDFESTST